MNGHSVLAPIGASKNWKCEFCGEVTKVDVSEEEMPKTDSQLYLIQKAPREQAVKKTSPMVVFCIGMAISEIVGRFLTF